jgi:catechol 2,3-dioxygenase-like lactoylglutathione lyase family enzyme
MFSRLDFVGIPSRDAERSRTFYIETLGLRPDERSRFEFWVGDTCFGIWEPARFGMEFAPQKNAHPALHVRQLGQSSRRRGSSSVARSWTPASARWPSSPIRTATT